MPSAKIPLFAYDFLNPTGTNTMEVELTNTEGKFRFEDTGEWGKTVITLSIPDTEEFGFVHREIDKETQQILQDLVTAVNLNSEKAAMSRQLSPLDSAEVEYTEEELEELGNRTYAEIGIGATVEVDEKAVIDVFNSLRTFDRFSFSSPGFKRVNLIKALNLYDNAVDSVNRYSQHMSLYMALEHLALRDGTYAKNDELDRKMSSVTGIAKKHFRKIRRLYNRQKHPDTRKSDIQKSIQILEHKNLHTRAMRKGLNHALKAEI